jgi:hypothetical protein
MVDVLLSEGKFFEAIPLLQKQIAENPANTSAACDCALAHLKVDMARGCLKLCDQAIASDPSCVRAYALKTEACLKMNKRKKARSALDIGMAACTTAEQRAIFRELLSNWPVAAKKLSEAIPFLQKQSAGMPVPDGDCCPVCMELLFPPVLLGCAHMFCLPCLLEIRLREFQHQAKSSCPLCRWQMEDARCEDGSYVLRIGTKGTAEEEERKSALHSRLLAQHPLLAVEQLRKAQTVESALLAKLQQQVHAVQSKRWTTRVVEIMDMPQQCLVNGIEYILRAMINFHSRFIPTCAAMLPLFHTYPRSHLLAALAILVLLGRFGGSIPLLVGWLVMGFILGAVYDFGGGAHDLLVHLGGEAENGMLAYVRFLASLVETPPPPPPRRRRRQEELEEEPGAGAATGET